MLSEFTAVSLPVLQTFTQLVMSGQRSGAVSMIRCLMKIFLYAAFSTEDMFAFMVQTGFVSQSSRHSMLLHKTLSLISPHDSLVTAHPFSTFPLSGMLLNPW